jgi:hypothetical protein
MDSREIQRLLQRCWNSFESQTLRSLHACFSLHRRVCPLLVCSKQHLFFNEQLLYGGKAWVLRRKMIRGCL